jgi:hypothetical protein
MGTPCCVLPLTPGDGKPRPAVFLGLYYERGSDCGYDDSLLAMVCIDGALVLQGVHPSRIIWLVKE